MRMKTYSDIAAAFRGEPRDVSTAPVQKNTVPKWFYVYECRNTVFVSSGRAHDNSCSIASDRRLKPEEFDIMLDIYHRRQHGENVSKEATDASVNQSYWFGIFKELKM